MIRKFFKPESYNPKYYPLDLENTHNAIMKENCNYR